MTPFRLFAILQLPTVSSRLSSPLAGGPLWEGRSARPWIWSGGEKRLPRRRHSCVFRPWIFLITDGGPTDEWKTAAEQVKQGETSKAFAFFAVGVQEANEDVLKQICVRPPMKLKGVQFRKLFEWLSASLSGVSRSSPGENVQLPNPAGPEGWASV